LRRACRRSSRIRSRALLITCDGPTFVAGGDIAWFDHPGFSTVPFNCLLARLEAQQRPVAALMHGTVLGGGLELALACHWRLAAPGTQFGMPEVKLGLLPGSLGTQRLPRLVGVQLALDLIGTGRSIGTQAALQAGLVDSLTDDTRPGSRLAAVRDLLAQGTPVRRLSAVSIPAGAVPTNFFTLAAQRAKREHSFHPAAHAIVRAVEASLRPFAEGGQLEATLFENLRESAQSQALRHLFFAQRTATRIPGLPPSTARRPVVSVGVLGAGTMGRGIAMSFLNAGIPRVLVETSRPALDAALAAIRAVYESSVRKGRLTPDQLTQRVALLSGALDDVPLGDCDLVIEAVYEDLTLKRQVFARLGALCKPGAIIATNTSTLDVDALALATGQPADVLGMHFFSPAHVMRLLEVVRGRDTAPDVLATSMHLARRMGKVAVVSGVCYGFIGNRIAEVYMREAEFLILEGAAPSQVDSAVESLGMPMGPCRMLDMAGIDVGARTVLERGKAGGLPPDPRYRALVRRLFELGRFGQKTGAGYYRYAQRKAQPDPEVERIAEELAARHRIPRRETVPEKEIVERLLYPMVNEAARILEEGIALRGSDIDLVWTGGYGFPDHRGGPLFMADRIGLSTLVERLTHHGRKRGDPFGYWFVSPLLRDLAARRGSIARWAPQTAEDPVANGYCQGPSGQRASTFAASQAASALAASLMAARMRG
jgi:3-hydroxyacyl-CoA dehydrogenase